MQIRPTVFTIGLIIYSFITLFAVYTEFGIDSHLRKLIANAFWLHTCRERFIKRKKFEKVITSSDYPNKRGNPLQKLFIPLETVLATDLIPFPMDFTTFTAPSRTF